MAEFVVWMANGRYLAEGLLGDREPRWTADMEQAQRFPSRMAALGACRRGPAAFFDHAAILPYRAQERNQERNQERAQERPAAGRMGESTAEPQRAPGAARARGEGK